MKSGIKHPYVIVLNVGTDYETEHKDFATYRQADAELVTLEYETRAHADIMKRTPEGTLTTEF